MGGTTPIPAVSTTDWRAKSFDVLSDATKQLITIATGVIAATVIFSKDLTLAARVTALLSWIALTTSVACGCAVLLNISGQLRRAAENNPPTVPTIAADGIRKSSIWQICAFVAGVLLLFIFGFLALEGPKTAENPKPITVNCHVDALPSPTPCQQAVAPAPPPSPAPKKHAHRAK
jgi:hypothetical protein